MVSYNKRKTLRDAQKKCAYSHGRWNAKVEQGLASRKVSKIDRKRLEALLGLRAYQGAIKASDLAAARRLSREYVNVIHAYHKSVPGLRWFHITLLADEFILSERTPRLMLKRLKGKTYKAIREIGLDGVACVEINPLPNHPQRGKGGSLLSHVHVLGFTERPFDLPSARKKLAASRSWSCGFGAKPTHIHEITDRIGNPAFWAAYDSKGPHEAKNHYVQDDGSVKLISTEKGYRDNVALRLAEGLSHIARGDLFFSIGEGKEMREEVMRRVVRWHKKRWSDQKPIKDFLTRKLWKRVWKKGRTKGYRSWSIIGSSL